MKYLLLVLIPVAMLYFYPSEADEKFRIVCDDGTDTVITVRDGVRYYLDGRPLRTKPGVECVTWQTSKVTIVDRKKKDL